MKFYVVYDLQDNIITTFENYKELSNFFGKTKDSMRSSVSRFTKGLIEAIKSNIDNKYYKVYKMVDICR